MAPVLGSKNYTQTLGRERRTHRVDQYGFIADINSQSKIHNKNPYAQQQKHKQPAPLIVANSNTVIDLQNMIEEERNTPMLMADMGAQSQIKSINHHPIGESTMSAAKAIKEQSIMQSNHKANNSAIKTNGDPLMSP